MKTLRAFSLRSLLAGAGLVLLQACAAAPGADAARPDRVVPLERMQALQPVRVLVPRRAPGDRPDGGTVVLRLQVDAGGAVRRVAIEEGSGDPALDSAAARSLQGARFVPYREDGVARPVTVLARMHFRSMARAGNAAGATLWP